MFHIFCQWLDSNSGPLESEATALPTKRQQLPLRLTCLGIFSKSIDNKLFNQFCLSSLFPSSSSLTTWHHEASTLWRYDVTWQLTMKWRDEASTLWHDDMTLWSMDVVTWWRDVMKHRRYEVTLRRCGWNVEKTYKTTTKNFKFRMME